MTTRNDDSNIEVRTRVKCKVIGYFSASFVAGVDQAGNRITN